MRRRLDSNMSDFITKNFRRHEFACNCGCGFDAVSYKLVENLQTLRNIINAIWDGSLIYITSGCRCVEYNKQIGGAVGSQHIYGKAADICIRVPYDIPVVSEYRDGKFFLLPAYAASLAALIEPFGQGGIGVYSNYLHVDIRGNGRPVRWGSAWRQLELAFV